METIHKALRQLEEEKNVRILYACETGSRAWGFPSPDSDYDVRFLYVHKPDWYLELGNKKDTIEYQSGDLDITGWDLRKSLYLLKKSNAPLIERFHSPIVYKEVASFKTSYMSLIETYYSPVAVFYHHYSIANRFWAGIQNATQIKLKAYFYLLRSLLCCNWIIHEDSVVPMQIEQLMRYLDKDDTAMVLDLINLKATVVESFFHSKTNNMQQLIQKLLQQAETNKNSLKANKNNYSLLNAFFKSKWYEQADS